MKQLLTLCLLGCLPVLTSAQCNSPIPANATVISTDGSYSIFGAQWVCGSVTATLSSGFVNAFIEGNANVTAETNLGVYSVRQNSTLTISGFNNNIYYDPTATIVDNGTNTFLTVCPDLTFDYTDAPADGCDPFMHVEAAALPEAAAFPNPTVDAITLTGAFPANARYTAYAMHGALVVGGTLEQGRIGCSAWPAGLYHVVVQGADGVAVGNVRVAVGR